MVNDLRDTNTCRIATSARHESHKKHKSKLTEHTEKAFTIFHQNVCGLSSKKEELLNSLAVHSPHIICLTEHHLSDGELENMPLDQYALGAKFCRKTHKCGGVCILIQDSLHFTNINMNKFSKEKDIEICAVKIHAPSSSIIVLTVYRSPTGDIAYFLNVLEAALNQLYNNITTLILCGDFNINYLNEDKKKQRLNSLLTSYGLYSVIDFPTRTNNSTSTTIDNIFINKLTFLTYNVYSLVNGISDHDAQILTLPDTNIPKTKNELYSYRKIDAPSLNEFQINLSHEAWSKVFNNNDKDTNIIYNNFLDTFLKMFNASFPPHKTLLTRNNKPWLTSGIKTSCNNKRKLYLLYRESNDPKLKEHYRKYCKLLTKTIILAKKLHYSAMLTNSTNKPKTTWNIIKSITNNHKKSNNRLMMEIEGKRTTHHQTIAEKLNAYYVNVADNITSNIPVKSTVNGLTNEDPLWYLYTAFQQPFPDIKLKHTTTGEIEKIITELKHKNSCGYDKVTAKIIQASSPYIVSPLAHICNRMLSTGTFPDRLKYAEVKPIYKKGDKTQITNYRPISLLPVFSKIFEKVLYKRLSDHLGKNNILAKEQFGFRCNTSTEPAIYTLIHNILSSLNTKSLAGGLFCDLQKAFDCVNHNILLKKLTFYGITEVTNKLIDSYLSNRQQRVTINNCTSTWKEIRHGVPQGSVLGPLLFLIYINDLSLNITDKCIPILYADDTSFLITDHDSIELRRKTNEVFTKINEWFHTNLLMLNYDKTFLLQFTAKTNKETEMQILCNDKAIATAKSIKFLGLTLDTTLNWKHHINELIPRLNRACYAIRAIKPFMPLDVLKSTYFSYAHSIMTYGLIFWGNSTDSDDVFKIQKRIIRVITNSTKNASCRELFKILNILPLQSQYIYSILLFLTKHRDRFLPTSHIHAISTRQNNNLYVPPAKLTLYQKGVYYSGIKIYNHLPTSIKNLLDDKNKFRNALKNFLLHNSFYSLEEYFNT